MRMRTLLSLVLSSALLAPCMLQPVCFARTTSRDAPDIIDDPAYQYPSFTNGEVVDNAKKGRLPVMGWNSWNAFGSANTEELTKTMADRLIELGLDDLGYKYVILDDGCYESTRGSDDKLRNNSKFPSGFKALSDYLHDKGLKFGMYNDIGTGLCAGAQIGTIGHEDIDAQTYVDWGIDFLKVDNCYYPWDNATFSAKTNLKYVFTPNIKSITVHGVGDGGSDVTLQAAEGEITGTIGELADGYVRGLGTYDGTNTGASPTREQSSELIFKVDAPESGKYNVVVEYATAQGGYKGTTGEWLQLAVGPVEDEKRYYDGLLPASEGEWTFINSDPIEVELEAGENIIRLMNHRRQENALYAYAALLDGFNKADPDHDIVLSLCEWGKNQTQDWGYKVGASWRVLNDICFAVGNPDGFHGTGKWSEPSSTASITSQYNKAVVMAEFAGLDKGWNDPDMMIIGTDGITETMEKTHMSMWCMMNSPLILGIDLRRVEKGDEIYNIIANKNVIDLNQDALGVQARRIYTSIDPDTETPDKDYITNDDRTDILAKPLANGDVAISFINLRQENTEDTYSVDVERIMSFIGDLMAEGTRDKFENADSYYVSDLWTGEDSINTDGVFSVNGLDACDNVTIRVTPISDAENVRSVLKNKISKYRENLMSKNDLDKPMLADAAEVYNAAIDKAENDAETLQSMEELLNTYETLEAAANEFDRIYEVYDDFEIIILTCDSIKNNASKYVENDEWQIFLTELENARAVYENPESEKAVEDASNALMNAKSHLTRNLGDGYEPVAWYTFQNEAGNTTVKDISENGNDASLAGSGAKITDDGILSLNENNEDNGYMELPDGLLNDAENYTFAAWLNIGEYRNQGRIFDFGNSSTEGYMFLSPYSGRYTKYNYAITQGSNDAEQSVQADAPPQNEWVHVAVIQDGTTVRLYENGVQVAESTDITLRPSDVLNETSKHYIGKSMWPDPYMKGQFKDIRVYDKALTEEQLNNIMADFGSDIEAVRPVNITVKLGQKPELPNEVTVIGKEGEEKTASVVWETYNESCLFAGKPFAVYGTVPGTYIKAQANIDFTSDSINDDFLAVVENDDDHDNEIRTIRANVVNKSDSEKYIKLVLAQYDENGALENVRLAEKTIPADSYDCLEKETFEEGETKVFLWNDMTPITETVDSSPYTRPIINWSILRPTPSKLSYLTSTSMEIQTEYGDLWNVNDDQGSARNLCLIDIPNSMRDNFTVEVEVQGKFNLDYQRAALVIYTGDGNQVSLMRRQHSGEGGRTFMMTMNENGKAGSEDNYIADTLGDRCHLKLVKEGDRFTGYFSEDGTTWTEVETRIQSVIDSADTIKAGVYASNGTENIDPASVRFENFRLNGEIIPFTNVAGN